MDSLLNTKQLSEYLGVSKSTVYRYIKNLGLPYYQIQDSKLLFKKEEVDEWVNHHKTTYKLTDKILNNLLTNPVRENIDKVEGGQTVARKKTRHNYGYGSVYVRKTKKGISRYYIEYYDSEGKRIQKVVKNAVDWNPAHEALRDAVYKVHFHKIDSKIQKKTIRFKSFSEIYLKDYAMRKKSWERSEKVYLNASLIPYFGKYKIRKITQHHIEQFIRERQENGVKKSSINRELSCLSMMFKKAISWGYLSENPLEHIKRFKEKDNMRERVLSEKEESRLLENCADHLKPIIITALNTGMRLGEILQLRWSQVDFNTRRIKVENTKSEKNRVIGINEDLYNVLKQRNTQNPYVFPNPSTGKALTTVKTSFKTACKRAGIENLRFNDLRHTFGTRLIQNGVDIETVRDLMGHHSIVVTQRYLHTNDERRRLAVESLTNKGTKKVQICDTNCDTGTKSGTPKNNKTHPNVLFSAN